MSVVAIDVVVTVIHKQFLWVVMVALAMIAMSIVVFSDEASVSALVTVESVTMCVHDGKTCVYLCYAYMVYVCVQVGWTMRPPQLEEVTHTHTHTHTHTNTH